ncbi:MAG TPA: cupin domain-containing protein [Myxococcaceae bacterium]|nr:cupin domain-containing protein [Myxococcaceae bacterium]
MQLSRRLPLLVALPAALALAADSKPPTMDEQLVVHVKDARWTAPKAPEIPPGAMVSPIASDPGGANIGYAKFPAGYTFPMHWHSATESTSLVSGRIEFTVAGKSYDLEPGSYIVIPPKAHHQAKCAPGAECILLTRRPGPVDYNWVK